MDTTTLWTTTLQSAVARKRTRATLTTTSTSCETKLITDTQLSEREVIKMIKYIGNCPFRPTKINGRKVKKIIFGKFAVCY